MSRKLGRVRLSLLLVRDLDLLWRLLLVLPLLCGLALRSRPLHKLDPLTSWQPDNPKDHVEKFHGLYSIARMSKLPC